MGTHHGAQDLRGQSQVIVRNASLDQKGSLNEIGQFLKEVTG